MKAHREWITILATFKKIPINLYLIDNITKLLKREKNVLVMIKKEDHELNPEFTQKEKFDELCKLFPEETKKGQLIISSVPDIIEVREFDL